jgi:hypothetical protein
MKFMILKKSALPIMLVLLIGSSLTFARDKSENSVVNSDESFSIEHSSKVIDYIDNTKGTVVLDDFTYRLKLNAKVYDQQKRLVNRYALKEGQRVLIEISKEGDGRYIDSIFILDK